MQLFNSCKISGLKTSFVYCASIVRTMGPLRKVHDHSVRKILCLDANLGLVAPCRDYEPMYCA